MYKQNMIFATTIKMALKGLMANKLRSILAMLGIIIGVGAVISMLAIGAGAKKMIMSRISSMGTNLLVLQPGQEESHGVRTATDKKLTLDDAKAVLAEVDSVEAISPVVQGRAQLKFFNMNTQTNVIGGAATYSQIRDYEIDKGRFFSETEAENLAHVVVLGPQTGDDLGLPDNPIDETIKLNGINFRVIGVFKTKGSAGFFNPDDQAIIPYTTAMRSVFGVDNLREVDIQIKQGQDLKQAESDISDVIRKHHKITFPKPDDFHVRNQADIVAMATESNQTFTVLLGSIASISLLVGGIGIMNIMLVTVTERTREIGVRKAIGAKDRDILRQFLIEAFIMSIIGGVFGLIFGLGLSVVIGHTTQFQTVVQIPGAILALTFSMAVGIFFGWYPARRAASLDPVDSLYYE
jgi:putative ABC transport system permease protein